MTNRTGLKACNFCTNTPVSFQHGEGDAAVLACLRCEDMIKDAAWDALALRWIMRRPADWVPDVTAYIETALGETLAVTAVQSGPPISPDDGLLVDNGQAIEEVRLY